MHNKIALFIILNSILLKYQLDELASNNVDLNTDAKRF